MMVGSILRNVLYFRVDFQCWLAFWEFHSASLALVSNTVIQNYFPKLKRDEHDLRLHL
jgi:hypothetical protein